MGFIRKVGDQKQIIDEWNKFYQAAVKVDYASKDEVNKYLQSITGSNFPSLQRVFVENNDHFNLNDFYGIKGTFHYMITLALEYPRLFPREIEPLKQMNESTTYLTKKQIGCLLAHLFYGNFGIETKFAIFSYYSLLEKYRMLLTYFNQLRYKSDKEMEYEIQISRRVLKDTLSFESCNIPMTSVKSFPGSMEDERGRIAIFANKVIGGGALIDGFLQEESLEWKYTESLIALLLCETMTDNEVVEIKGVEKFSNTGGYGNSTTFRGPANDTEYDKRTFVLMDSLCYDNEHIVYIKNTKYSEYDLPIIQREIHKVYLAAKNQRKLPFVTGNWGCGAFGSTPELKLLIQWIGCSLCEVDLKYYYFDLESLNDKIKRMQQFDRYNIPLAKVYNLMVAYLKLDKNERLSGGDSQDILMFVLDGLSRDYNVK